MYRKSFIDLYLTNNFDLNEAKSEIDFILDVLFNYGYKDFILGKALEKWQTDKVYKVIEKRVKSRKPIQQILGQAYFYKRKFFVNESVLIPRPETELLVSKVLELCENFENPKILDIGTGSGCIPISLILEKSNIYIDSVDISYEAIEIAKKNALFHNVLNGVKFFKSDIFSNVKNKYNIIVSNPPYIPYKDKETLQVEVKNFEPSLALFTKDDLGMEYYEKIIEDAYNYLLPDGYIIFECGINQSSIIKKYLESNKYKEINIIKDFNLNDRIVLAKIDN